MNSVARSMLLVAFFISFTPPMQAEDSPVKPFKAQWNVRDHIPLEEFTIQSHRGAGELAPENTLEAFELGWKLGTIPEADVRTTNDGVIVAFHDSDFSRVVRGIAPELKSKGVADVSFDDLGQLDVGAWRGDEFKGRRVSRMTDIYALMQQHPERRLYLDYKDADLEQLADEVRQYGIASQVLLASSKHDLLRRWKKLLPNSGTLLWIPGTEKQKRATMEAARKTDFDGITQLQIHVRMPGDATDIQPGEPFSPSRQFLGEVSSELAERGILFQTLPYGASDAVTYAQLLDAGLASFATDYPDVTLNAVREYYEAGGK
ncbi:MAG: hypothetical protein IT422_18720 [Pirellulaceae bacterium]|nr:hypothetical protein [Pirellulaceae bacterium]